MTRERKTLAQLAADRKSREQKREAELQLRHERLFLVGHILGGAAAATPCRLAGPAGPLAESAILLADTALRKLRETPFQP